MGASIRVLDSLQDGVSRFYAEITRLRKLVDLTAGKVPLLFLLDEFLHGTNSHDRKIGAEAIVRGLVERNAIGLVTTHDLALAHIADALAPRAANVHFEDHLEDGKMTFDYIMRPGRGEQEQRAGTDALDRPGCVTQQPRRSYLFQRHEAHADRRADFHTLPRRRQLPVFWSMRKTTRLFVS